MDKEDEKFNKPCIDLIGFCREHQCEGFELSVETPDGTAHCSFSFSIELKNQRKKRLMIEIPKTRSIKLVRRNVEELLMATIQEFWHNNMNSFDTFLYLDEVIDWFEGVGVYEKGELRKIMINKLGDRINAKIKEINK